jgi:hypothetical protein
VTGIADPARIFQLFKDGATIVLQGVHRFWPPLARFCRELEVALGHPAQVNAYITPPGSRGLAVHSDGHDVFVLQAFGRKHWEMYEPPASRAGGGDLAGAAGRTRSRAGAEGPDEPTLSVELRPGEVLYIPRGTPHAARTQEAVSGHLTVGILAYTWATLFREVLARVEREPEFAERLPVGYHQDPDRFAAQVAERLGDLRRWLDKADPREAAEEVIRRFLTTRPPLLGGTLAGLLELEAIGDDTPVRRRPLSVCELQVRGDLLLLLLGDRELQMPARVLPAMRLVRDRTELRPKDLAPHLDREGRVVLVRRLVREGLLEIAAPGAG